MEKNDAVQGCSGCPICNFTRKSGKESFFYKLARRIQSGCPTCKGANESLKKDYQKSLNIK